MTIYYTYKLIDPRTNLPFYVGKGCRDRMYTHWRNRNKPKHIRLNHKKCQVMQQLDNLNLSIIYDRVDAVNETVAYDLEKLWIGEYGRLVDGSGILTNIAEGGSGNGGWNGNQISQYSLTGEFVSDYPSLIAAGEATNTDAGNISSCLSQPNIHKTAGGYLWKLSGVPLVLPPEHRSSKCVYQFDLSGTYIAVHASIKKAAGAIGIDSSGISLCCSNHHREAGGFQWSLDSKCGVIELSHAAISIPINQYDINGVLINTFPSIMEASRKTKLRPGGISRCGRGLQKLCGGYRWQY